MLVSLEINSIINSQRNNQILKVTLTTRNVGLTFSTLPCDVTPVHVYRFWLNVLVPECSCQEGVCLVGV